MPEVIWGRFVCRTRLKDIGNGLVDELRANDCVRTHTDPRIRAPNLHFLNIRMTKEYKPVYL